MKYQIYLNKETSEFVNLLSKKYKVKPCTFIKLCMESTAKSTKELATKEMLGELKNELKEQE